jgi:uncharacterized repeat protein (TIGR01451 family)
MTLSLTFTATPVLAEKVISEPGGTTITVQEGQEFTLSFRFEWDEPGDGRFAVPLSWVSPENNPAENFTIIGVSAYFDNGQPIIAAVRSETEAPFDNGTLYVRVIGTPVGEPGNGPFNVDITVLAGSKDFAHIPTDNHPIRIDGSILVAEDLPWFEYYPPDPVITVRVVPPPPGQPTLFSPADGTKTDNNTPTFEWTNGSNADNHRLLVDNDPSFSSPEIDNTILGPDNTFTPSSTLPDENYSWKVIARNAAGDNESSIWTFIIDTTPPDPPTLVWPDNRENINDNTPNLDWEAVSDVSLPVTYDVWVDNDPDFSTPIVTETGITDDNYQVMTELAEGVYYWRVRATDNAGYDGENSQRSFRVDITAPIAPTPLEPADETETNDSTPTFRWTAVPDESMPVTYELQVDNDTGFGSPEINVSRLADNTYTPIIELADENYSWRVRAVDNAGNVGPWSSVWKLSIKTVVRGVDISISPLSKSGAPGETLTYTLTVTNEGNVEDTYSLSASAMEDWSVSIEPDSLPLAAGAIGEATLSVVVPPDASSGDGTQLTIEVESTADPTVREVVDATAEAEIIRRVQVSVSPLSENGPPGENITFTVTIKNTGNVLDSYSLTVTDNTGWGLTLSENLLEDVQPGESETVTLSITIPEDASLGTDDKITVTATSTENTEVSRKATVTAQVTALRRVEVSISPKSKTGAPGGTLTYTIFVKNTGNVADSYSLTVSDNAGWGPTLSENLLEDVQPTENETVTLSVTIPDNAFSGAEDEIIVTATSQTDNTVSDNDTGTAKALIVRGVEVSVSPGTRSGPPNSKLEYTVTVRNEGNVRDTYDLTVTDTLAWGPAVSPTSLTIAAGGSATATLSVTIPEGTAGGTRDEITIKATSKANPAVSDSATLTAQATALRGVEVSISPGSKSGAPGETLTYSIMVKNTGSAGDTYTLSASGDPGWAISVEPTSLTIAAGDSENATLSVVVPLDAVEGTSMTVNVTVTSEEDPEVTDRDTCRSIVKGAPVVAEVDLTIPLLISAFVIGAALLLMTYLLRARPKKATRRRVLRDVGFGSRF